MTEQRRIRFLFPCLLACVVATLVAIGLTVWVQRTQSSIQEIMRMGGGVMWEPGRPAWLLEWIGDERKVVWVYLSHSKVTDAGLRHLRELTNLRGLILDGTQVTDAGLVHLKGLTNLRRLVLKNTQVTDAGVEKMKNAIGDHFAIDVP